MKLLGRTVLITGAFSDISATSGPGITGAISSRGLALGDFWNDGRISAVVSNMNAPPSLLVNQVRTANHWIELRPIGTTFAASPSAQRSTQDRVAAAVPGGRSSVAPNATEWKTNRDAIGARVRVKAGSRILVDEVRSGSSFDSNNDIRIHFGLGAATKIDWIEVRWPSGVTEMFPAMPIDAIHDLKEGTGKPADPAKPANEKK